MNILITSAGRQVFLVKEFKKALNRKGKVFSSDLNGNAAALKVSDKGFASPPFTDPNYIEWILEICALYQVHLLVSLNVDDLMILENQRNKLEKNKIFLVGGSTETIRETHDKYALSRFCSKIGLYTPSTYLVDEISNQRFEFPILAKPRFGKGSRGHINIHDESELNYFMSNLPEDNDYVLQKFLPGQEYGIDIVNDFDHKFAGVLARKKLKMKNGETYEAITDTPTEWIQLASILSLNINHQGTIDVDIILYEGMKYVIDINHRFGGGYIFNHVSGANVPKAYVEWFNTKKNTNVISNYLSYQTGIHSKRSNIDAAL